MRDAVAAEWLKLRTVQSTFYLLFTVAMIVLLSALLAWQIAGGWDAATPTERQAGGPSGRPEQVLILFVQLIMASLGVLAITGEYATRMIRTSLLAVPRRGVVLAAKAVVVGGITLVIGEAGVFAMYGIGQLVVGDRPIPLYTTAFSDELPLLLSLGLSVMVAALLGLGLGTVTRSTTGGLTGVVALVFVLPPLGRLLPEPWDARFIAVTLPQLPEQLAGAPDAFLTPLGALAALTAYVVTALVAGAAVLRSRDA